MYNLNNLRNIPPDCRSLTESALQGVACPGFCVVMPRISREGDAPNFACGEGRKAALGRGFRGW